MTDRTVQRDTGFVSALPHPIRISVEEYLASSFRPDCTEDSLSKVRQRVDDYLRFGTKDVWVIDPELRKAYVCSSTGFQEPEGGVLAIAGSPIRVVLSELFAELDRD